MSLDKLRAEGTAAVGSLSEEILAQAILDLDAKVDSLAPGVKTVPLSVIATEIAKALVALGFEEGSVAIDLTK